MVGVPASGKTTIAHKISKKYKATVLSSDEYRKRLCGTESDQSRNEEVFKELYSDMRSLLLSGKNVIVDATNINRKARRATFSCISNIECYKIAYVVNTPIEECYKRDDGRDRHVTKKVIDRYISMFNCPQYFEGFDEIIFDHYDEVINAQKRTELMDALYRYNQRNYHHKFTLGEHSSILAQKFVGDCTRREAGILHDIGKRYTQTFKEGEVDEHGNKVAHYYGHANYSSYICVSNTDIVYKADLNEFLDIVFYVEYHMCIRDMMKSKKVEQYKKLFGDKYDKLVEFAHWDEVACGTGDLRELSSIASAYPYMRNVLKYGKVY